MNAPEPFAAVIIIGLGVVAVFASRFYSATAASEQLRRFPRAHRWVARKAFSCPDEQSERYVRLVTRFNQIGYAVVGGIFLLMGIAVAAGVLPLKR